MAVEPWQRHQRVGVLLTVVFVLAGSAVAWFVVRDRAGAAPVALSPAPGPADNPSVVAITLPHAEPDLPPGPHRDTFQVSCTICHSTQLVLNQPLLTEKKWVEVVHKMVATYGAPMGKDQEADVVQYLYRVHGKE